MTEYLVYDAPNGHTLRYRLDPQIDHLAPRPGLFTQPRPLHHRPTHITIRSIPPHFVSGLGRIRTPNRVERGTSAKLAGSRDNAFAFLRSVIAAQSANPAKADLSHQRLSKKQRAQARERQSQDQEGDMPAADFLRVRNAGGTPPLAQAQFQLDADTPRNASIASSKLSGRSGRTNSTVSLSDEKPLASGNGVSVTVNLAEPLMFLQGFDQHDTSSRTTVMLRGSFILKVQKSAKIKSVNLKFRGVATTKWPEGIPPRKTEFEEVDTIMSHTWPFFDAKFNMAESGADLVKLASSSSKMGNSPYMSGSPITSNFNLGHTRDVKHLSLQHVQSRSFDRAESNKNEQPTVAQKGYRMFHPGEYIYNFELPLDSRLPETINVELGSVKYELEASVERAGAFRANLFGTKDLTMIRAPSEGSLEQVEPIAISRNWEDQLHYDIVISGKSFPLGSKIPIAFKLTPLAKVQCHRVKVFITENIEYFCSNKRVHRMEPTRKILLFEKRADGTVNSTFPGSTHRVTAGGGIPYDQREAAARGERVTLQDTSNLLGRLEHEASVGPTEMEFSVQLPGCQQNLDRDRGNQIHFNTTYQNIQVHHWIKIVLRLSRPDADDPSKRRHFEISIDSPFHILSCRANSANTALPAYTSPDSGPDMENNTAECGCPGAPRRRISPSQVPTLTALNASTSSSAENSNAPSRNTSSADLPVRPSLARPPTAHLNGPMQRPIHMLRAPSFNPPAFNEEEPPPPLVTPPPQYNDIASPTAGHGLADYFSRLTATYNGDEEEEEETEEERRTNSRGRVNLPLTPGGRVNRSMDIGDSRTRRMWASVNAEGPWPSAF